MTKQTIQKRLFQLMQSNLLVWIAAEPHPAMRNAYINSWKRLQAYTK